MNYLIIFLFRLEEKVSDMEAEEQICRQQALVNSASRKMSHQVSFTGPPVNLQFLVLLCIIFWKKYLTSSFYLLQPLENGHHVSNELDILFCDRLSSCTSQVFIDRVSLTVFLHSYRNHLLLYRQEGLGQNLLDDLELNDNPTYVPNENIIPNL